MIRRPPRSTLDRSSAASDVYKRQELTADSVGKFIAAAQADGQGNDLRLKLDYATKELSLIHISEPTRPY